MDPKYEKSFTFLKVEYLNPLSLVNISFDPVSSTLVIDQKFPFYYMTVTIYGYSMPIKTEESKPKKSKGKKRIINALGKII